MSAKKKTSQLPRVTTRTITARSLLLKIRRLILEEPGRLNMTSWVSAFRGRVVHEQVIREHAVMPACGTVACLAGWGAVLLRPDRTPAADLDDRTEGVMGKLFGVGTDDLFSPDPTYLDQDIRSSGAWTLPPAGTQAHADAIAKRIDAYMARYPRSLSRKIDVAAARKMLAHD